MSSPTSRITRRAALKRAAATSIAFPYVMRAHATAAPSETLYHASFGSTGMARADIGSITASPHVKLVAVADVDLRNTASITKRFPGVKVYQDWRELLDKEKHLDSVNVSTPDHMHGSITMRALQRGLNVYCQKPLTQTIYEARQVAKVAREKKLVTQMGIQIHSHPVHRTIVATIQAGVIGKVIEVLSWSGKHWGDRNPRPGPQGPGAGEPELGHLARRRGRAARSSTITTTPANGGSGSTSAPARSATWAAISSTRSSPRWPSPHPGPCAPRAGAPTPTTGDSTRRSATCSRARSTPPTPSPSTGTTATPARRPSSSRSSASGPCKIRARSTSAPRASSTRPTSTIPSCLPKEKFKGVKLPDPGGNNHYLQFVEACRGNGKTSTPFDYSGPLTESVLLGCLATRFPKTLLEWDPEKLAFTNASEANRFVRRRPRKGWEVEGL